MNTATRDDTLFLCINLASDTERRARMQALFAERGIDASFIEAVPAAAVAPEAPGAHPRYDHARRMRVFAHPPTPAEHACVASHAKALTAFLATDKTQAYVFEDNADLHPDFPAFAAFADLAALDCDIVKLDVRHKKYTRIMRAVFGRTLPPPMSHRRLYHEPNVTAAASALLYSRHAAQTLLDSLDGYYLAYDTHVGQFWRRGLRIMTVVPAIAPRAAVTSTIRRQDKALGGLDRTVKARPSFSIALAQRRERVVHEVAKYGLALWRSVRRSIKRKP